MPLLYPKDMMEELKDRVVKEAIRWFRAVMRKDGLEKHEAGLFEAVAMLRADQQSNFRLPSPPPLPTNIPHAYASKTTDKDFPAQTDSFKGTRNYDTLTTKPVSMEEEVVTCPVPMEEYEEKVVESVKKKDPYDDES